MEKLKQALIDNASKNFVIRCNSPLEYELIIQELQRINESGLKVVWLSGDEPIRFKSATYIYAKDKTTSLTFRLSGDFSIRFGYSFGTSSDARNAFQAQEFIGSYFELDI